MKTLILILISFSGLSQSFLHHTVCELDTLPISFEKIDSNTYLFSTEDLHLTLFTNDSIVVGERYYVLNQELQDELENQIAEGYEYYYNDENRIFYQSLDGCSWAIIKPLCYYFVIEPECLTEN